MHHSSYTWGSPAHFAAQAPTLEKNLIFSQKRLSYISRNGTFQAQKKKVYILLKKVFLIFREMQFSGPKVKKFQKALNSKLERQKNVFIFS